MKFSPAIRRDHIFPLIAVILAVIAHINTLGSDFVSDDTTTILFNSNIHDLSNLRILFTEGVWPSGSYTETYYRPIIMLSLAFDYHLWQGSPFGYHLTNLILHAVATGLCYLLASRLLQSSFAALACAMIFAVHPVHVETVAWITARGGIIISICLFSSLILYLQSRESGKYVYLLPATLFYLVAAFTYEVSMTFPGILLLYELISRRDALRQVALRIMPFVFVAVGYLVVRTLILGQFPSDPLPFIPRLLTGLVVFSDYLRLLSWPVDLKLFYDVKIPQSFFSTQVMLSFVLFLVYLAVMVWSFKANRLVCFSLGWVLITLTPFLGLLVFPRPAMMAERFLYVASYGFCLLIGVIVHQSRNRPPLRKLTMSLVAAGVCLLLVGTITRNRVWANDTVYYEELARNAPTLAQAHNGLGVNYVKEGRLEDAREAFETAIELSPGFFDAYYNLGVVYLQRGEEDLASEKFRQTLQLNASFADAHDQLGLISFRRGNYREALAYFSRAVNIDPRNPRYQQNYQAALRLAR